MSIAEQMDTLMRSRGGPDRHEMFRTGITLGKVTNITDDKNFNRVKCLPIGSKDEEETDWCYVMTPMGGKECGAFFFPQVDDLVVLAYLDGDPHRPLVLGGFWNTDVKPPLPIEKGKNEDYLLRTPNKIELAMHDKDKEQKLTVTMPSGTVLELDDKEKKVHIHDKEKKNELLMELESGSVTLKAEKKLTLVSGKSQIVLTEDGNIEEKGSKKLTESFKDIDSEATSSVQIKGKSSGIKLEGASIEGKANGQLKLQSGMAAIKSNGMMEVSASGVTTVKGSILKLN
ncbi:MAG: hypothetical protein J5449_02170 [Oscillospiraceae bacterium]|nr:hypothetical protein [Oscillospiraceae bacterium]